MEGFAFSAHTQWKLQTVMLSDGILRLMTFQQLLLFLSITFVIFKCCFTTFWATLTSEFIIHLSLKIT